MMVSDILIVRGLRIIVVVIMSFPPTYYDPPNAGYYKKTKDEQTTPRPLLEKFFSEALLGFGVDVEEGRGGSRGSG